MILVANNDFKKEHTRERAHGYKSLSIEADSKDYIKIIGKEDKLIVEKIDEPTSADEEETYTMIVKEFGLFKGVSSDIDIIFLDEGYMLVTLKKGALVTYLDGSLCIPNVNQDSFPDFSVDEVLWVDEDYLLSYARYFKDDKDKFLYDFEFALTVSGEVKNGMSSFKLIPRASEDRDISLGAYGLYIQTCKTKEDVKRAKTLSQMLMPQVMPDMEFEEDEFEDDEFEEDDFEDDEFEDDEY